VAYPKEFSVILLILLVGICSYLLILGKLSGRSFVFSLFVCAAIVAIMHNLDVLQRVAFKGAGMEGSVELQQIRSDVYAKADEVHRLGEQVAGMIAESVATSNRFGGSGDPDPVGQEVRYRDNLNQTLKEMGTTKERREEILAPFAKWVPFDLRSAILQTALDLQRQKSRTGTQMNEFSARLKTVLEGQPPIEALDRAVRLLHDAGLDSPKLEQDINRYRTFLKDDRLPPL
jgi:hypothetical protein